jgi:hypothetical protein
VSQRSKAVALLLNFYAWAMPMLSLIIAVVWVAVCKYW